MIVWEQLALLRRLARHLGVFQRCPRLDLVGRHQIAENRLPDIDAFTVGLLGMERQRPARK